jgi:mono/diheme cytochrome c family protein
MANRPKSMSLRLPGLILVALACGFPAEAQTNTRTVLDGVYTDAQAARGQAAYEAACSRCHGDTLVARSDSQLRGDGFMNRWGADNLDPLFRFIRTRMPAGAAGTLGDSTYLDIVAYVLKANTFPAGGQELTADGIGSIQLVDQDPSKPLPANALVRLVGCLTEASGNAWELTHSTRPVRTSKADETTPQELRISALEPLAAQVFRLQNPVGVRPGIIPAAYQGHKVQVNGVMIRQGGDRINVTSLETVAETCAP